MIYLYNYILCHISIALCAWANTNHRIMNNNLKTSLDRKVPKRSLKNKVKLFMSFKIPHIGNINLSAALDYYGSEKARVDFLDNKEEPADIIGKNNANADTASS